MYPPIVHEWARRMYPVAFSTEFTRFDPNGHADRRARKVDALEKTTAYLTSIGKLPAAGLSEA